MWQMTAGRVSTFFSEQVIPGIEMGLKWLLDRLNMLATGIITWLLDWIKGIGRITPDQAPQIGTMPMRIGIPMMAGLGGITLAGELLHPLKQVGLGHVSAMIYDVSNYGKITGGIVGALIAATITTPFRYYLNAMTLPWLPDLSLMHEALGRGKIDDDTFKKHMAWFGIGDEWFSTYKALAAKPISPFIIRYLGEAEIVEPDVLYDICIDAGYSQEHADYLAKALSYAAGNRYRSACETAIVRCYKEGYITKEHLLEAVDDVRKIIELRQLIIKRAEWEEFYDSTKDKVDTFRAAFRTGILTEEEFLVELEPYVPIEYRRLDILDRERIRKAGRKRTRAA